MERDEKTVAVSAVALGEWIRAWVADTVGEPVDAIAMDASLVNLGLTSRDAIILSGELAAKLGRTVDPTIAYEYPTIASLAAALVEAPAAPSVTSRPEAPNRSVSDPAVHDIAIVGMAGRLPQGVVSLEDIWETFYTGRTLVTEKPDHRWEEYAGDEVMTAKMAEVNLAGGYLTDIDAFDAEFFGLSPVEAANMDPQQRLMMEVTWEALEDARIPASSLRGTSVGVYIGSSNNDYGLLIAADPAEAHPYALTGTASSIIPNRISYAMDFRGPSVNVDTACSSSLVAIHQAVRGLRDGDADVAVAGGVNIMSSPFVSTAFGELGVISPTNAIHAFSDDADGFVRADAVGALILKRVGDAIAAGDRIYAVIKGSAVTQDGHSNGLTAPNPEAQADCLARAYADAGVDPATVDYIEAHGTGTILGDPIEAQAVGEILGARRDAAHPTLIGSAKSNVGHSESAAGSVAMLKTVLAMAHDTLPPTANFTTPNKYIDFAADKLEVIEDAREWPEYSGRKLAGVSGFGFGGTNAHVVVSEFVASDYAAPEAKEPLWEGELPAVVTVSGLVPSRRKEAAAALTTLPEDSDLTAVARATAGRNHARSAAAVIATSAPDLTAKMTKVAQGSKGPGIEMADAPDQLGPVFLYSGFGSQHRKMATNLVRHSPRFAARLRELDELVQCESGWSMLEIITDDALTYDTETAQVTITAIQIAITDFLADLGVIPAAVMGMSMGEIAAAYACGGLSAADAMIVACHRSRLMGEGEKMLTGDRQGAMAVAEVSAEEIATYKGIEAAVFAGPGMTTVGGLRGDIEAMTAALEAEGKTVRQLNVKGAGHTSALDPILGELAAECAGITPQPITIPLFSSVDRSVIYQPGTVIHDVDYWLRCTRQPVYLQDATEQAFAAGHTTIVEIAPNPVGILGMVNTAFFVGKADATITYTLKRKVPEEQSLTSLLAQLYAHGVPVDLRPLYGDGPVADLAHTAFRPNRYWTAARPNSHSSESFLGHHVSLPDGRTAFSARAEEVPSAYSLVEAAAEKLLPGATVSAFEDQDVLPPSGEVTTLAARNIGGVTVSVFRMDTGALVAEGFAVAGTGVAAPAPEAAAAPAPETTVTSIFAADDVAVEARHWDPESGESVQERLTAIVSESMGYEAEDLPGELPLIDLGLDSLMGIRIKNRIENDFQIPPLNVQTLRDASVTDVIALVEAQVAARLSGAEPASAAAAGGDAPTAESTPSAAADAAAAEPVAPDGSGIVPVAPRDASERLVFATWSNITGAALPGVTHPLPEITSEQAEQIAARLTERANIAVDAEQIGAAVDLEALANIVREGLETEVEGHIRVLRARPEGSTKPAVFMFHPAGGSSVVYSPLMRRLPDDVPVYGVERLEGSLAERASAYLDDIANYSDGLPVILGGWSFGGAVAAEVARQLHERRESASTCETVPEVALLALLDTVQPHEPIPNTVEEAKARWGRYAEFAKKTYGIDIPVPYDVIESQGEEAVIEMLNQFLGSVDASAFGLAAGVLEHQRASFVDNRILDQVDLHDFAGIDVPVLLFRAERMHDGAIELEPRYAHIDPDGGWASIVKDLEIVQLHGDHLAVVDEPEIGTVGTVLSRRIDKLQETE
ncbi:MAG: polyketide synthase Pks13 [Corynebacterium sp.]|nr:polyketide synthase Pks13 [Corynebacterium sp.]